MPAQRPPGTRVLPTADWFAGVTAMAGGIARGTSGHGLQMLLFNDAPAGQYLWLWMMSVFNDAEGTYQFVSMNGHPSDFLQQGAWITIGLGSTFGQVYAGDVTTTGFDFPQPGTRRGSIGAGGDEAGTNTLYRFQGPIAVIPPGFSFGCYNDYAGTGTTDAETFALTFYYSILPYIPDKSP
jgi:hypothetical protein